ncbi:hypothetical protein PMAYCL1PPCAC_31647 [Pristionchus mayeri]|uniref:Uncharacterized protein n=1 Tax=Pristionchus mayeri TaxID=1317129 RepID=A0AAN5ICR3_9BILA|nr:hypothetical protein PMAYCL1PPCAC_31647 [Pristionchus mayeri]
MMSARSCLLVFVTLVHVNLTTTFVIEPNKTDVNTVHNPEQQPNPMGHMMHLAYNQSIPGEAIEACAQKNTAACPSPSADGTHLCVTLGDICDHRPQCPGAEDETPVICFFHEMRLREITRLRNYAIALFRIPPNIPRRHSQRGHGH